MEELKFKLYRRRKEMLYFNFLVTQKLCQALEYLEFGVVVHL